MSRKGLERSVHRNRTQDSPHWEEPERSLPRQLGRGRSPTSGTLDRNTGGVGADMHSHVLDSTPLRTPAQMARPRGSFSEAPHHGDLVVGRGQLQPHTGLRNPFGFAARLRTLLPALCLFAKAHQLEDNLCFIAYESYGNKQPVKEAT